MFYSFNDTTISIYDYNGGTLIQPFDPTTCKYFETTEEALAWTNNYILSAFSWKTFDMDILMTDDSGNALTDIKKGDSIKIQLTSLIDELDGAYTIKIMDSTGNQYDTLDFNFEKDIATAEYSFRDPGDYYLQIDNVFTIKDEKYIILSVEDKFNISIKPVDTATN